MIMIIIIIIINNHEDPHLERLCESFTVLPNLIPLAASRTIVRCWTAEYNDEQGLIKWVGRTDGWVGQVGG